jgi:hypothetical protein
MSDFFGGLSQGNIRFTDARIDGDGPLPTSLSGPEGINGDPDGRYNFNDSLLAGITPYAFGQGRMGADRNYQQIPNRKQFPVPPIFLPEPVPNTENTFEVSHSVDMGDVAFILNVKHKQLILSKGPYRYVAQDDDHTMPQWNVFCNICTVNYILAGLHNFAVTAAHTQHNLQTKSHAWYRLFMCFDITSHLKHIVDRYKQEQTHAWAKHTLALRCKIMLQHVVKQSMVPVGICAMSEKQGGQHEIGLKPVQAAASFFTTLTVDGQNRDLVNIWRGVEVDAGDFLIFRLEFCEEEPRTRLMFVLNHYYKDTVTRTLPMHEGALGRLQLVPDVFRLGQQKPTNCSWFPNDRFSESLRALAPALLANENAMYDFAVDPRYSGYWHIGQTYTKKQSFTNIKVPINDMEMTKGQLLQINFAPVWKGTIHADLALDPKNVPYCLAYALQRYMFGNVPRAVLSHGDVFVDAVVSEDVFVVGTVTPAKKHKADPPRKDPTVFPTQPPAKKDATVFPTQPPAPANDPGAASPPIGIADEAGSQAGGQAAAAAGWDFEKDIENMFAEATGDKPKASKAKAAK